MEILRSTTCDHKQVCAARIAIFGGIVARVHFEFADSLYPGRRHQTGSVAHIGVFDSVDLKAGRYVALTVYGEPSRAVEPCASFVTHRAGSAWQQLLQGSKLAAIHRE